MLSVLGALVTSFGDLMNAFTMVPLTVDGRTLYYHELSVLIQSGQYWRLVTPIFLHFGIIHLLFNALWLMLIGQRIELFESRSQLLVLVVVTGVAGNLAQFWWQPLIPFGGMSGVVYGLLGYLWLRYQLKPHPAYFLPPGIMLFMLIWLAIGFTPLMEWLFGVGVANFAHLGGLISGFFLALVPPVKAKPLPPVV